MSDLVRCLGKVLYTVYSTLPGHQHEKILRDNSETGDFLIEPVRIFECFLGQRNSKIRTFLINNTDASVGVCCSHKVVAVGFNTLCYDASVGVLNPPHE